MRVVIFHGSPRKGNTYIATEIFKNGLSACGEVSYTEFYASKDVPVLCTGCQTCLGNPFENCPHSRYTEPLYKAIMEADALVFATPHYGASAVPGGMKNLMDHLDFLTLTVAPRKEIFEKKAFVLTTGTGSSAAAGMLKKYLKNWGVNRVYSIGIKLFTDQWSGMPPKKQKRQEERIRRAAGRFYAGKMKRAYISTVFMYYVNRFVIRRYIGEGHYPYEYWKENGYFDKCPFCFFPAKK